MGGSSTEGRAGSVAFVTGGGSGIGRATALLLARRGARVAIFDIAASAAEQVALEIRDAGGTSIAIAGDTSSEREVAAALERSSAELGDCDVVVTAAAILNDFPESMRSPRKRSTGSSPSISAAPSSSSSTPCRRFGGPVAA